MPSSKAAPTSMAALTKAIDQCPSNRLRVLIKEMCNASPETKSHFEEILLVNENEVSDSKKRRRDDGAKATEEKGGKSLKTAKISRYATCINCEEDFEADENASDACEYHSGELEVCDEAGVWDDHDERCHGTIDTEDMRKEYPEGFRWDCCDVLGDEEGCVKDWHKPMAKAS